MMGGVSKGGFGDRKLHIPPPSPPPSARHNANRVITLTAAAAATRHLLKASRENAGGGGGHSRQIFSHNKRRSLSLPPFVVRRRSRKIDLSRRLNAHFLNGPRKISFSDQPNTNCLHSDSFAIQYIFSSHTQQPLLDKENTVQFCAFYNKVRN